MRTTRKEPIRVPGKIVKERNENARQNVWCCHYIYQYSIYEKLM